LAAEKLYDVEDLPAGAIIIVVQPGQTELEQALVEERDRRQQLEMLKHPKKYLMRPDPEERTRLGHLLRTGGKRIRRLIARWREGE
jgi:hypothetical protein